MYIYGALISLNFYLKIKKDMQPIIFVCVVCMQRKLLIILCKQTNEAMLISSMYYVHKHSCQVYKQPQKYKYKENNN